MFHIYFYKREFSVFKDKNKNFLLQILKKSAEAPMKMPHKKVLYSASAPAIKQLDTKLYKTKNAWVC